MSNDMATVLENLRTIRDNMITEMKDETAYRAQNGPKVSYSLDGQSFSWTEWLSAMNDNIQKLSKTIAELSWYAGPSNSRWSS